MTPSAALILLRTLDALVLGLQMAPQIMQAFSAVTASVQNMVMGDRDPTEAEWAELDTLRDTIHRQIQEAHRD